MVAGAVLVAGSAAIHLKLWTLAYGNIHIIGPLFLAQAIAGFVVALFIAVSRWVVAAATGAVFMLATIGGLLISVWHGLFGFQDSFSSQFAGMSLFVEAGGAVVLLAAGGLRLLLRIRAAPSNPQRS
jgi:hypothetical protein